MVVVTGATATVVNFNLVPASSTATYTSNSAIDELLEYELPHTHALSL